MPDYHPLDRTALDALAYIFGDDDLLTAPADLDPFRRDESGLEHAPEAVVLARSTDQVSRLLRLANEMNFPVTPRGAGTGLAGGALARHGGVVLCLAGMNRIKSIDIDDLTVDVEPGVITDTLRRAVAEEGLFFPPDPASLSESTIGGNAATNAGGPACVKYGVTRDYVLGLEAVLPSGEVITAGTRTRKGVVGYDMAHLLVGSEGTLGIITGLTLKLIPLPPETTGLAALFPDLHSAMEAVTAVMVGGILPSALEFMDHKCLDLVGDLLPFPVPKGEGALVIVELDGEAELIARGIDKVVATCRSKGAVEILPAPRAADRAAIWDVRRQVSTRIHEEAAEYIPEDVAVPLGRIADLIDDLPGFERDFGLYIYAFGHAGDGNIHLNITAGFGADPRRTEAGVEAILRRVLAMGGTISGEHGVGQAKQPWLPLEIGPESIRLQKGIKKLFDPNMILNPDKIL